MKASDASFKPACLSPTVPLSAAPVCYEFNEREQPRGVAARPSAPAERAEVARLFLSGKDRVPPAPKIQLCSAPSRSRCGRSWVREADCLGDLEVSPLVGLRRPEGWTRDYLLKGLEVSFSSETARQASRRSPEIAPLPP